MTTSQTRSFYRLASIAVALIVTMVALPAGQAATRTWGATGGSAAFNVAGNWGVGGVPGSADTAAFTGSTATTCNITASATVAAVTVSGNATLALTAGQTLTVTGDYTQTTNTPTVAISGGILKVTGAFNQSAGSFTQSSGTLLLDSASAKNLTTNTASFFNLAINDGLVGYWKLDEGTTPVADSSGYGNTGTLFNTPTWAAGPTLNFTNANAMVINGTSQYASLGNSSLLNVTGQITMAAWVKIGSSAGAERNIVAHGHDGNNEVYLRIKNGNYETGSYVNPADYMTAYAIPGGDVGAWVHMASVYDGTTWRLYRNGVQVSSSVQGTGAVSVAANWAIGARGDGTSRWFQGTIDEVRIYKRGLNASEINSLYIGNQPGTASPGAVQTLTGTPTVSNNLILASGALSIGSGNLTVGGSWNNYGGLFTPGSSTVTLNSATGGVIRSAGQAFTNLIFNRSSVTWTLEDWLRVSGSLTLTNGALSPGAYDVHAADLIKTSGTLTAGTGTVVIDTTTAPAGDGSGFGLTFNNLRIETTNETNLKGYWKLDEGQGTTIRDASGTGNVGSLFGNTDWTDSLPGAIDFDNQAALSFNDTNAYAEVGTTSLPANNANQTISAWVNLADSSSSQFIVALWDDASSSLTALGILGGALKAFGWSSLVLASTTLPSLGVWHHIAYTYDGTTHKVYVDGGTPATGTTAPNTHAVTRAQLGAFHDGTNFYPYSGLLDDVRIYNVALSAAQIQNLFAGGYAGTGGGATVTLGANLTVNKTLAIDNGTLDTSGFTINAAATDSTQTALVNAGTLKVGSARATFNGGLTVGAKGTVTEDTAGGAIALGAGEALEYGYSGTVQGFPTAAFDWSSFAFWREYVTYRSYTGSGTATDTVLALSADGGTKYAWALPTSKGSLLGTPRWNTEVVAMVTYHYIYLITTLGYVYKVLDTGSALTTVSGWPYQNVTGGTSATATSPLVNDGSNLYWSGNDGGGLPKFFSLTLAGALNAALVITATSSAAPALATVNLIPYVFLAISGKVYQETLTLGSQFTSTQGTTAINGRISFNGNNLYFPENNGTVHARTASSTAGPTVATGAWPYQDISAARHISTCSGSPFTCPVVSNVYVDIAQSRICFGDADGHIYVLNSAGAPLTGFPWQPGTSADNFQTAPLSRNGVLLIGAANGNLYEIDENNGTTRALTRTYVLPAAVSSISFNPAANGGSGGYVVGAGGKLYYLGVVSDPSGPI